MKGSQQYSNSDALHNYAIPKLQGTELLYLSIYLLLMIRFAKLDVWHKVAFMCFIFSCLYELISRKYWV